MAETQKPKIVSKLFPTTNFFKRIANYFGGKFHYTPTAGTDIREMPVYKRIEQVINFSTVKELNEYALKIERNWDPVDGEHITNLGDLRKRMLDIYSKDAKGEIPESLGPFTDPTQVEREGSMAQYGTPNRRTAPPAYDTENIAINKYGQMVTGNFSIPSKIPIIYQDGRGGKITGTDEDNPIAYTVAFFGHANNAYWTNLTSQIGAICEELKNRLVALETDPTIIKNISENIDFIREVQELRVNAIKEVTREIESKHRSNLVGGGKAVGESGVFSNFEKVKLTLEAMHKLKLTDEQIHFTHTFKVVNPIVLNDDGTPRLELRNQPGWTGTLPNGEFETGYDEHGWPLEVGDGVTKIEGNVLLMGQVLIDLYKGRPTVRTVPKEFIVDLDPLYVAYAIYYYYDAFRDDVRDGRYHDKAVTVVDRIMTELGTKGSLTMAQINSGVQSTRKVNLNELPDGTKPHRNLPDVDPKFYTTTIKPVDRLPAFDTRAKYKTKHIGRMYYWEGQNESVQSTEPTITSRGTALYLLHKVIEESKYWGGSGDPAKAGVVELMNAIGQMTNGFDMGPNMGPGEKGWGKPFSKNPFNPDRY